MSDKEKIVTQRIENLETNLVEVQTQLAFIEDTIEKLDQVITHQSQLIANQQRQLQLLYQKLESQMSGSQIQPFDLLNDRPPHY